MNTDDKSTQLNPAFATLTPTHCTEDCERRAICTVCGREKAPIGRDVAAAMAGTLCDRDCPGYHEYPEPGHLWPGELARIREEER